MKSFIFAALLFSASAHAATYGCLPNHHYPVNTDIQWIEVSANIQDGPLADVKVSDIELEIDGVKQMVRPGTTDSAYFYALDGDRRELAFEMSYEDTSDLTKLSMINEFRLYVYGKNPMSSQADPIPAYELATFRCEAL